MAAGGEAYWNLTAICPPSKCIGMGLYIGGGFRKRQPFAWNRQFCIQNSPELSLKCNKSYQKLITCTFVHIYYIVLDMAYHAVNQDPNNLILTMFGVQWRIKFNKVSCAGFTSTRKARFAQSHPSKNRIHHCLVTISFDLIRNGSRKQGPGALPQAKRVRIGRNKKHCVSPISIGEWGVEMRKM